LPSGRASTVLDWDGDELLTDSHNGPGVGWPGIPPNVILRIIQERRDRDHPKPGETKREDLVLRAADK
jgi:hypothetical protein